MPLPLPWFNNNVDPLLPDGSTFPLKSYLYKYDEYQTYDILIWDKVSDYIDIIFPSNFAIQSLKNAVFNTPDNYILFDRFTPDNHPWCDDYSSKIFDLVKRYSGTDYYRTPITSIDPNLNHGNESKIINFSDYNDAG
jgi:hypothetical protein